jgi:hypothetical protein
VPGPVNLHRLNPFTVKERNLPVDVAFHLLYSQLSTTMTNNFFGFTPIPTNPNQQGQVPTGAGAIGNVKRKSRSFSFDEDSNREVSSTPTFLSFPPFSFRTGWHFDDQAQSRRMQSPPFERRSTCPYPPQPELIHDNSNTVSDTESPGMDMDMDQDMGGEQIMQGNEQHGREGNGISVGYSFGNSGSGGFGFGPGAEEDEEEMVAAAEYRNGKLPRPRSITESS